MWFTAVTKYALMALGRESCLTRSHGCFHSDLSRSQRSPVVLLSVFFPFPALLLVPCNWLLLNQTAEVAQLYPTEEMFRVTCASLHRHCNMEVMPILRLSH